MHNSVIWMGRTWIAALAIASLAGCKQTVVEIAGSETMQPMMQLIESVYESEKAGVDVIVTGGGSEVGIEKLLAAEVDAGLASRAVRPGERRKLQELGALEEQIIAYDALAVVVHRDNPLTSITLRDASDIFSGKVKNWKELGGPDLEILPVIRDDNSGTADYFREHVLRLRDLGDEEYQANRSRGYAEGARVAEDNLSMAATIENNPGAVGFMGLGSAETEYLNRVKALDYALQPGEPVVAPKIENVYNRTYKLSRPLYFLFFSTGKTEAVREQPREELRELMDFMSSDRGQKLVQEAGSLRAFAEEVQVEGERPK